MSSEVETWNTSKKPKMRRGEIFPPPPLKLNWARGQQSGTRFHSLVWFFTFV